MTGQQVSIPAGARQALSRVGAVSVGTGTVDISDGVAMTVLRFPGQQEHVIIRVGLDPVPSDGRDAGVLRHVSRRLGGEHELWVSAPRVLPWGTSEPDPALTAEVLRYRADALMWHGLAESLVDGVSERDLAILIEVNLGHVTMPVPVSLYPSPENAHLGWVAEAWLGPDVGLRIDGAGLCSMTVLRDALASRLAEESFADHEPAPARCASTLDDHMRCGEDWDETPWAARVIALLLGLCRHCATNVIESQSDPLPIQPRWWGEQYK